MDNQARSTTHLMPAGSELPYATHVADVWSDATTSGY